MLERKAVVAAMSMEGQRDFVILLDRRGVRNEAKPKMPKKPDTVAR